MFGIRMPMEAESLGVVVFSGSDAPGISEQAYAFGADSVFLKPGSFRQLVKLAASLHTTWGAARKFSPRNDPAGDAIHLTAS